MKLIALEVRWENGILFGLRDVAVANIAKNCSDKALS